MWRRAASRRGRAAAWARRPSVGGVRRVGRAHLGSHWSGRPPSCSCGACFVAQRGGWACARVRSGRATVEQVAAPFRSVTGHCRVPAPQPCLAASRGAPWRGGSRWHAPLMLISRSPSANGFSPRLSRHAAACRFTSLQSNQPECARSSPSTSARPVSRSVTPAGSSTAWSTASSPTARCPPTRRSAAVSVPSAPPASPHALHRARAARRQPSALPAIHRPTCRVPHVLFFSPLRRR